MKRLMDISGALLVLTLTLPLFLLTAAAIAIFLGWPVFFYQERPGRGGRLFRMIKFRSMSSATGADGRLLPDQMRLTRFGRLLRASSLDELPELINVLKGDMSLVGPRPLLPQYLPLYSPMQARRHEVRPGLTGWAQVHGRNAVDWTRRFELDVWYVDNRSPWLDLRILWRTVSIVLNRRGINPDGKVEMPMFEGDVARQNTA